MGEISRALLMRHFKGRAGAGEYIRSCGHGKHGVCSAVANAGVQT